MKLAITPLVFLFAQAAFGLTPTETQLEELNVLLKGKNVGMITNPTSVLEDFTFIPDKLVLDPTTPFNLSRFFAPEHGMRGDKQGGAYVEDYVDDLTGRIVYSIYGSSFAPSDEQLQGLDALLFDIQDVGTRFYTFVWSMTHCMEAAAKNGKMFVVLDRPNPIGADVVEGPPNTMDAGLIGRKWANAPFGVPTRHGMTVGEIAMMVNNEWMNPKVDLHVIKVPGYTRDAAWESLGRPWVMPSPNMPTFDGTAIVYPGAGNFEDVNGASEGRGTTRPFEILGTPAAASAKVADELTERLNNIGLPGVSFRTTFFVPTFGKYINKPCGGVQIHVTDPKSFKPVVTGLHLVQTFVKMFPNDVTMYQSMNKKTGIENLTTKIFTMTVDEIEQEWMPNLEKFMAIREKYLLYN